MAKIQTCLKFARKKIQFICLRCSKTCYLFLFLEMDDEDCERRRMECLDEMSNLEKQFTDLKDQ